MALFSNRPMAFVLWLPLERLGGRNIISQLELVRKGKRALAV